MDFRFLILTLGGSAFLTYFIGVLMFYGSSRAVRNAEVFKYEAEFRVLCGDSCPNTRIGFAWKEGDFAGLSDTFHGTIFLNPTTWENYTPDERRELVWHELGHFYFTLFHSKNECSLMYATWACFEKTPEEKLAIALKEYSK